MTASESFIQAYFQEHYGVRLRRLESCDRPMPDFEVRQHRHRLCVCELKELTRVPRTPETGWKVTHHPEGFTSAERDDNGPARVGRVIHEAYKQLKRFRVPRVLIILNRDGMCDIGDLHEAVEGFMLYGNERFSYVNWVSRKVAAGIIKHETDKIDLYVWVDYHHDTEVWFRCRTERGNRLGNLLFNSSGQPWSPPRWTRVSGVNQKACR